MLFICTQCVSCTPEILDDAEPRNDALSLEGIVSNGAAFKVQLVKGDVVNENISMAYVDKEAQVFVTESDGKFKFGNLMEGIYTLIVSKKTYKIIKERVEIRPDIPNMKFLCASPDTMNLSYSDYLDILDEEAQPVSDINLYRHGTLAVSFYLYNKMDRDVGYSIDYVPYGNFMKSFIINGEIRRKTTTWINRISPRSGTLEPNDITLVEMEIDPNVYILNEHAHCVVSVNGKSVRLFF